jgi:hypothetical protein
LVCRRNPRASLQLLRQMACHIGPHVLQPK